MYVDIVSENNILVGRDLFRKEKFRASRIIVDNIVELQSFRDKILVKTPRSHYIERQLRLCIQEINSRDRVVVLRTYGCRGATLIIPEFGDKDESCSMS